MAVCVRCGNECPSWLIHTTEDCIPRRGTCPRCGERWTDHGGTEDPICRDPREDRGRACTYCAMPDAECWGNRRRRGGYCCPRCEHPRSTFGKVYPDEQIGRLTASVDESAKRLRLSGGDDA